eukprot:TRINITY_DN5280_c0_g1_i11.p1 TRINITY_DN5280_c0_g1~~TRINITY_DN5280_c0_g1_i11.p1  ORF type:complete len:326 (-),score=61.45 TRINITY_DN5280_c0_g1_i11:175-1152(-)
MVQVQLIPSIVLSYNSKFVKPPEDGQATSQDNQPQVPMPQQVSYAGHPREKFMDVVKNDTNLVQLLFNESLFRINCTIEEWSDIARKPKEWSAPLQFPTKKQRNGPRWPVAQECDTLNLNFEWTAQSGQDRFLVEYIKKCEGTFVDIGAGDGKHLSSTLPFESTLNWKGICIEGNPLLYPLLRKHRPFCSTVPAVVSSLDSVKFLQIDGKGSSGSGIWDVIPSKFKNRLLRGIHQGSFMCLQSSGLQGILDELDLHHIDYLSVDVSGGERWVLESIDWQKTTVSVISISERYGHTQNRNFLEETLGFNLLGQIGPHLILWKDLDD